jgi:NTE family protein
MLHRTFGTACIEELDRSFFSAHADLRSSQLVVDRYGPVWDRVGSSVCMPVLAPPRVRGSELIADGSLIDNLPVGTMAALGEGPIIAVDVKATFSNGNASSNGARPAPAARVARTPALGETLTRVLLLGSAKTSDAARRHADFVINPRNEGVGLLEFHQLDRARESGRMAALEALEGAPDALFA